MSSGYSMDDSIIEQGIMELQTAASSLQSFLLADLKSLMLSERNGDSISARKAKPYLQHTRLPTSSPLGSTSANIQPSSFDHEDPNPLPEFIEHAYQYFVANIHNPYPTREEKQAIVDKSNNSRVTLTSVSNWFTNARRRCGWAEILKRRCGANREEMVDIAKRVFVKEDPDRPVHPQVVAEFMEMKESVETMYEKKTRTSAWIEDLGNLDELLSTLSSEKHHEKGLKDRRQRKKMQAQTLGKNGKATRRMQRNQDREISTSRVVSLSATSSSDDVNEDEDVCGSMLIPNSKRKNCYDGLLGTRGLSPSSSISSISFSSNSSDGRVPSLSWSDSGDEERPHKRSRSNVNTPSLSSPVSPDLLFPLDESFGLNPSSSFPLTTPIRGQKRPFDLDIDTDTTPKPKRVRSSTTQTSQGASLVSPSPTYLTSDFTFSSPTLTTSDRRRSSFAPIDFDSLLTLGAQEPQPVEIAPPDTSVPLEVGVFDWSNPLDSFDLTGTLGMNMDATVNGGNSPADFSQLFQFISPDGLEPQAAAMSQQDKMGLDAGINKVTQSPSELLAAPPQFVPEQSPPPAEPPLPDLQVDLSSFDLTSLWPQNHPSPQISLTGSQDLIHGEGHIYDLSGLMSGLASTQLLDNFGFDCSIHIPTQAQAAPTPLPDTLQISPPFESPRSPSVTPTWASTSVPPTPAAQDAMPLPSAVPPVPSDVDAKKNLTIDLSGQDLAMVEKALKKEFKRRELEEKKAALERERAKLEMLERELEED